MSAQAPGTQAFVRELLGRSDYAIIGEIVEPRSRGKGVGKRLGRRLLTKLLEKGARHVMCLVDENNPGSRGLHASLGYRDYGRFKWLGHSPRPKRSLKKKGGGRCP